MNGTVILMLVLSAAAAAAYILRRVRVHDIIGTILKSAASLCFVALGLTAAAGSGHAALALPAVMALVAGLAGDIFLNINMGESACGGEQGRVEPAGSRSTPAGECAPEPAEPGRGGVRESGEPAESRSTPAGMDTGLWTLAGFGAFILDHLCNMGFMNANGAASFLPASIVIGVLGGIFIYCAGPKLMGLDFGALRLVSSVYSAVIITGTAQAVLRVVFFKGTGPALYAVGYVLFLLSDLVLSRIMFTADGDTPGNIAVNLALYYAAQILIAFSLLWL